jgi:uncharacterized membrane protein
MHISGRLLALAVVAVTAFAWLRAIDSVEQMTPRGNSMDYVRLTTPLPNNAVATDTLLFWPRLARPLKASDFQQPHRRIYALGAADLVAAQKQLAAAGKRYRFQDTVTIDGRSYKTLLSLWGKHRVSSPQQLLAPGGDLQPRQLWVLEQIPRRTLLADDEGGAPKFFYVVEPLSRKLLRYRESELPKIGIVVFSWSVPTVLFGALAFLVLWRRGGDSSMARWAGIWLGGVAAWSIDVLVRQNFVKIDMPSVALAAQDSTGGRFMLVLYATLMLIFATVTLLHNAFVPQWALYAYFSRLQTPVAHGHTWISRYRTPIFLMMVGVANYGFFLWLSNMEYNQKIATIGAVNIGMMCVCWLWQGRHGQRQHAVSWNAVLAFLAANMLIWLINMPGRKAHDFGVLLNVLVSLLFIFWFARAVFHDDLLRLAGGRDISFIVSVIVLPIVFEASAEHARAILHGLGLFSETATGIIGTVAVVLLVHPFQHLLSTIFTRLANPGLSRVRKVIDQYTEEATESGNLAGRGDPALQIFYGMGITRFGFYACGAAGHLIELINNLDNDTPEIQISPSLRKKLSETKTFIDLKSAAFEWHYFYEQFELCRLERQLGCRYLFPVCLGHSLRAILCLGDDASSRKLARDAYSEHINNLGIAKLSSTPATRPPSAR